MSDVLRTSAIVVGVDGSDESVTALEEALAVAERVSARIVMAHASPVYFEEAEYEWISPGILAGYKGHAKSQLESLRAELSAIRDARLDRGVPITLTLVTGEPVAGILSVADDIDADLVVVGSRSRGVVSRFLLGSVAERISRFTERETLIARGSTTKNTYRRIVVPTDFSKPAMRAARIAERLAVPGAAIDLCHCVEIPPAVGNFATTEVLAEMKRETVARLEELAEDMRERGFEANAVLLSGYPPHAICEQAANADLVVMGSHGRRGVRRWVLGSVAEKTIRHAPCSVYIARAEP